MTERNPALDFQNRTDHTAENDRAFFDALLSSREGAFGPTDQLVVQRAAGANMSVDVGAGKVAIKGDTNVNQGMYVAWNDAAANLVISASSPSNPRRDLIVARVRDAFYTGATNAWDLMVITGTPAAVPTDPTVPDNCLLLARIAVGTSVTTITNANITDLRPRLATVGGRVLCTSTTRPSSSFEGLEIYESDTDRVLSYDGSAWIRTGWLSAAGRTGVKLRRVANQSIATTTYTVISWDTEDFDSDAFFAPTSGNITVPAGLGGLYAITVQLIPQSGAATDLVIGILNTTSGVEHRAQVCLTAQNNAGAGVVVPLAASDVINIKVYQNAGTINYQGRVDINRIGA